MSLASHASTYRAISDGRFACHECGDAGPHDDNGCTGSRLAFCCKACGTHMDADDAFCGVDCGDDCVHRKAEAL